MHLLELNWISLTSESPLIGKSIKELAIRTRTGASIVGIIRNGKFYPNPDARYRFAAGDLVAVLGEPQQISAFEDMVKGNFNN